MTERTYLLGSDPETFLTDKDGVFYSAHDIIPGTKYEPFFVTAGAIQVDGVAAEFNTFPARHEDEWFTNHMVVLGELQRFVDIKRPDLTVTPLPTATFSAEYFASLPMPVKELGCTPDFNAYTEAQNDPPSTDEPFRTGGGHVHIGWGNHFDVTDDAHFRECCKIVKQLDATLYEASLIWDNDQKRRTLYGKAGAFRPKSYGVEYRPLSNRWLRDETTIRAVYRITMEALTDYDRGIYHFKEMSI